MELSDYIRLTLDEITKGVQKADESLKKKGGYILTTAKIIDGIPFTRSHNASNPIIKVAFRIGVEVEESKEGNNKLGGSLKVISANHESLSRDYKRNVHEVSFELPMLLPHKQ